MSEALVGPAAADSAKLTAMLVCADAASDADENSGGSGAAKNSAAGNEEVARELAALNALLKNSDFEPSSYGVYKINNQAFIQIINEACLLWIYLCQSPSIANLGYVSL